MDSPYAQVAVLAQLGRAGGLFTYRIPPALQALISPGSLVEVPFTNRRFQGVVCSREDSTNLPRVRDISTILDPVPVLTPHGLRLAGWIAEYYAAPLSDVIGAMIPPGLGRRSVYLLEPGKPADGARLTVQQRAVLDVVAARGRIAERDVARELPEIDVEKAVASLTRRSLLIRSSELAPPRVSPRITKLISLAGDLDSIPERASKQRALASILAQRGEVSLPDLARLLPGASATVASLERRGMVHIRTTEASRDAPAARVNARSEHLALSPAQRAAYQEIAAAVCAHESRIFLLHGVTGSGKTEVYLQAIDETIRRGRQAIMMVPEISLTPQAVERVASRFLGRVAVLHSKLSDAERLAEWQRLRHGEVDIVVGPRSALFAPLPRPGLIIVDEEHDPSYKQDASPRYNARDAAAVLGRMTGAAVVFGSATPDTGTYHAAQTGRIRLLELPERPVWGETGARPMPPVQIVDMRHELRIGNRSMFSEPLLEAVNDTVNASQQSLLFLNRRGHATVVLCRDCGYVVRCPRCDIPLTYHAAGTRLVCHRCDLGQQSPRQCPACSSPRIRYLGVGTQRVEEEIARHFPRARVLRWDRDVTGGKDAHREILDRFARHEADILVGTQMIAKGLDFPLVTLVGVISADSGLHLPDFRAPERSFQLLTQVAGRAGRAALPSRVIVQTYTPDHYAIRAAARHDYHGFYGQEMHFRRTAAYPPFGRLVRFVYSSESETSCRTSAANLRAILEKAIGEEGITADVIGPAPCFVARIKNRYQWQVIVRGSHDLHPLLDHVPPGWSIDVDPVDLL
ncbi:MAG TPA: primosomal protein N' [Chloroflexota bacterium]|nr:primosomal protein N' [Chloroflexota bacterium]